VQVAQTHGLSEDTFTEAAGAIEAHLGSEKNQLPMIFIPDLGGARSLVEIRI